MKKQAVYLLAILIGSFYITSCGNYLEGTGELTTKEMSLDEFNKFTIEGTIDVRLTQGSPQKVMVTAQPNIIDQLKTNVANKHWKIGFETSIRSAKTTVVEITIPDIEEINILGSGNIDGENDFNLDRLEINVAGSGEVDIFGKATTQEINLNGSGDVKNFDLLSITTKVAITGTGDVEISSEEELNVQISGVGDVKYKGTPNIVSEISGVGQLIDAN